MLLKIVKNLILLSLVTNLSLEVDNYSILENIKIMIFFRENYFLSCQHRPSFKYLPDSIILQLFETCSLRLKKISFEFSLILIG